MGRVALQNVAIYRLGLQTMQSGADMWLTKGSLTLRHCIQTISVNVGQGIMRRYGLRNVTPRAGRNAKSLIPKRHINKCMLIMITSEVVHMFALQFVLDPFSIRGVPDKRKNGANAFHKKCSLARFSIVESRLSSSGQ